MNDRLGDLPSWAIEEAQNDPSEFEDERPVGKKGRKGDDGGDIEMGKQNTQPKHMESFFRHVDAVKTDIEAVQKASKRIGEINEATMLHTKAIAIQDTAGWTEVCKVEKYGKGATCRIGVPYPDDYNEERDGQGNEAGWAYNCYVNKKTEEHWVPLLEKAIAEEHGHIFDQK